MTTQLRRPITALTAAVVLAGSAALVVPEQADATPPRGVTSTTISQVTTGGRDYVLRKITLAPGGSTGWHYHQETLYGYVAAGTLSHNDSQCRVDGVYRAGQSLTERAGADNVHIGRNLGSTPVVLYVFQVDPAGGPLSVDQPNPGCPFD